jgi:hypothetical protein
MNGAKGVTPATFDTIWFGIFILAFLVMEF